MKQLFHLTCLFIIVHASSACTSAQSIHQEKIIAAWERARAYTKEYLDAASQEVYDFKPTAEIRSFAEQMQHLAVDNYKIMQMATEPVTTVLNYKDIENLPLKSKAEVTKAVLESYDFAITNIKRIDESRYNDLVPRLKTTIEDFIAKGFEHQTHHRGQCTIYLRLKGITPPTEKLF